MYHPRLRSVHSPLTPIPPMNQSSFDFSPNAVARCLEACKSTTPTVLKSKRSFTPENLLNMSTPDVSLIDFLLNTSNSSTKHFVSPCLSANNCNSSWRNDSVMNMDNQNSERISSIVFNTSLNINNRHLDVSAILDDLHLTEYSTLFAVNEIDLDVFLTLNDDELQEIGVENELHREYFLKAIARFNGNN